MQINGIGFSLLWYLLEEDPWTTIFRIGRVDRIFRSSHDGWVFNLLDLTDKSNWCRCDGSPNGGRFQWNRLAGKLSESFFTQLTSCTKNTDEQNIRRPISSHCLPRTAESQWASFWRKNENELLNILDSIHENRKQFKDHKASAAY